MTLPNDGWLLRDFIREALYNRTDGYFTQPSRNPVGVMSKPIPFHALLGQEDYARVLAGRYAQLASQWLTPVEIFRPHYANAIARYILAEWHACGQLDSDSDLTIYELGGGTGTCAANILAHIRDADPRVFARTKYVGVEVSLFYFSHLHVQLDR
jgi:SAM-dependent MidA family methyltransferase